MIFDDFIDSYLLLSFASFDNEDMISFRVNNLDNAKPIKKVAFDTRRINQEVEYIPRRNLQNYQRGESFISEGASKDIDTLFKVKNIIEKLKQKYMLIPEWLDSYSRVLLDSLNRILRVEQKDYDYSEREFNYIFELIYNRYRLSKDDLIDKDDEYLYNKFLDKDEILKFKDVRENYKSLEDVNLKTNGITSDENFIKTLFSGVKATSSNKEVERTVTITIKDKIVD